MILKGCVINAQEFDKDGRRNIKNYFFNLSIRGNLFQIKNISWNYLRNNAIDI